jgi:hypothetical protein
MGKVVLKGMPQSAYGFPKTTDGQEKEPQNRHAPL